MKSAETREIIIAKVFKLLLQRGYKGVSISDIQHETGMARGLLYHYFGGKEQLFVEATAKYLQEFFCIDPDRARHYTIGGMIRYMLERYADIMAKSFGNFAGEGKISIRDYDFLFYQVTREDAAFARAYEQYRARELAAWKTVVKNSINAGELRNEVDPERSAACFVYLLDGIWMNIVTENMPGAFLIRVEEALTDYYRLLRK